VIEGRATRLVAATPTEVAAFVLDLERYRRADHKIARVRSLVGDDTTGEVVFTGRLRGLPTPADRQRYTVSADKRTLEFRSATSRWPGALATFHGLVLSEPTAGGTSVTHIERFFFSRPLAWAAEPYLRAWLARDTAAEMDRLAEALADRPASRSSDATA
jgi:hypothetical protein